MYTSYCIKMQGLSQVIQNTHRTEQRKMCSQHEHFLLLEDDVISNALFLSFSKCSFSLVRRSCARVVCACSTLSPDSALISENKACSSCNGIHALIILMY